MVTNTKKNSLHDDQPSNYIKPMNDSSLYWNLDWMELFWDPITGHLSCSGILWGGKLKKQFDVNK